MRVLTFFGICIFICFACLTNSETITIPSKWVSVNFSNNQLQVYIRNSTESAKLFYSQDLNSFEFLHIPDTDLFYLNTETSSTEVSNSEANYKDILSLGFFVFLLLF